MNMLDKIEAALMTQTLEEYNYHALGDAFSGYYIMTSKQLNKEPTLSELKFFIENQAALFSIYSDNHNRFFQDLKMINLILKNISPRLESIHTEIVKDNMNKMRTENDLKMMTGFESGIKSIIEKYSIIAEEIIKSIDPKFVNPKESGKWIIYKIFSCVYPIELQSSASTLFELVLSSYKKDIYQKIRDFSANYIQDEETDSHIQDYVMGIGDVDIIPRWTKNLGFILNDEMNRTNKKISAAMSEYRVIFQSLFYGKVPLEAREVESLQEIGIRSANLHQIQKIISNCQKSYKVKLEYEILSNIWKNYSDKIEKENFVWNDDCSQNHDINHSLNEAVQEI